jgi:hypothetical protein
MNRFPILVSILFFSGCELFEDVKETFEGLTNPLVAQSVFLGVEADGVDPEMLEALNVESGVAASVFLADANNADEMENAPISGAIVHMGETSAVEAADGTYVIEPGVLTYVVGTTWVVTMDIGEATSQADFTLPNAPQATVPTIHAANTSLDISLEGQGFDIIIGTVGRLEPSEITWSNEPTDARDVFDLATGSSDGILNIPPEAFPSSGAYVIGVGGLTKSRGQQMDNMNTALSNITAGKMKLFPVVIP